MTVLAEVGAIHSYGRFFDVRSSCPACRGRRFRRIFEVEYAGSNVLRFLESYYGGRIDKRWLEDAVYALDECGDCGLVFQRAIPNRDFLNELYDRWLNQGYHPDKDPAVEAALVRPEQSRDGHEIFAVARHLGKPLNRLRVLDYGMGWGTWARVARRLGCTVYGFDLSSARREFAAECGITVVDGDRLAGLELDFVNTEQVFEHLSHPLDDSVQIGASLRPGGIFKVAIPYGPFIEWRLKKPNWEAGRLSLRSLNAVHPLEHLNCWTPRALQRMAELAGMIPVKVRPRDYLGFLQYRGALDLASPRQVAKSLLRPVYHRLATWQMYRWFVRPV